MSFLNKKEQVLDIELTQYGKYMLSKGRLKPTFYVFSDDEILYNVEYVGDNSENNAQASDRIQKDTQRMYALYEHDGVETRVLTLNGHDINKARGHGFFAQKSGRVEKLPLNILYQQELLREEKMGLDDRNLVRNFIGMSSQGEQFVPSWKIDSILDGRLESVNVSSSSPNVGIKRPVLNYEIDYEFDVSRIDVADPAFIQEGYEKQTGFEKEIIFKDNVKIDISDGKLLLSIIEQNAPYEKTNFEYCFFEIEGTSVSPRTGVESENLKKIYFKESDEFVLPKDHEIEKYFDVFKDSDVTAQYNHRLFGTIPIKVLSEFEDSLDEYLSRETVGATTRQVMLQQPEDICD